MKYIQIHNFISNDDICLNGNLHIVGKNIKNCNKKLIMLEQNELMYFVGDIGCGLIGCGWI
jgi:hypothetical protein